MIRCMKKKDKSAKQLKMKAITMVGIVTGTRKVQTYGNNLYTEQMTLDANGLSGRLFSVIRWADKILYNF